MKLEATFTLERETKNTYRYQEELSDKPPIIGTLYVQKWALGSPPPRRIHLTVEVEGQAQS
jgi:hypothetical protein